MAYVHQNVEEVQEESLGRKTLKMKMEESVLENLLAKTFVKIAQV